MKVERNFKFEPMYKCCLLAEEVGELISAVIHGVDLEEAFREKEEINK